ncbi:transposase [Vagococcus allomyrinae]|uniref:transposase n=1 Tax=Vagococcus allomyrinae TaxID=2794353 RepID=UPI001FD7D7C1|nr:transposase [Vagococcus allomyrinae]
MGENNQQPKDFTITNAKVQDRAQIEVLVNKPKATYIVDQGCFGYKLLDKMHRDGVFFVTRTKKKTLVSVLDHMEIDDYKTTDGQIISDQHVALGGGKNSLTSRFRLVTLTKGQKLLPSYESHGRQCTGNRGYVSIKVVNIVVFSTLKAKSNNQEAILTR